MKITPMQDDVVSYRTDTRTYCWYRDLAGHLWLEINGELYCLYPNYGGPQGCRTLLRK
jgi:hypothetical protein